GTSGDDDGALDARFPRGVRDLARARHIGTWFRDCASGTVYDDRARGPRGRSGAGFDRIFSFLGVARHGAAAEHFRTHLLNSSFADDGTDPMQLRRSQPADPWSVWTDEQRAIFR